MKTLTVYTKTGCGYCIQAKDHLKKLGIDYQEVNISDDPEAREKLIAEGHTTLPVLYAGNKILVRGGFTSLKTMRKEDILERLK